IDQNVEPAVLFGEVIVSLLVILRFGDIKAEAFRGNAFVAEGFTGCFALFRIARPEDNSNTLLPKLARSLQAEPAISAGNECNVSILFRVTHFVSFSFLINCFIRRPSRHRPLAMYRSCTLRRRNRDRDSLRRFPRWLPFA